MDTRFSCFRCGQKLAVDATGEGTAIPCPTCGADLVVPTNARPARRRRGFMFLAGAAVLVFTTWLYFTPHLALRNLRAAGLAHDAETISEYVDYPALRESLKANVNASMAKELADSPNANGFALIGNALAASMVNKMVDAFVTPEAIAMMMQGQAPAASDPKARGESEPPAHAERTMHYRGLNRFVLTTRDKSKGEGASELIFHRHGLASWRLSAVRLPEAVKEKARL